MSYFVYLLECSDGTYYCGYTNDLEKRLVTHNSVKGGSKYTKSRKPVTLVYSKFCIDNKKLTTAEYKIKQLSRTDKK